VVLVTVKQVTYYSDVDEIRVMEKGPCHLLRLAFLSVTNKLFIGWSGDARNSCTAHTR